MKYFLIFCFVVSIGFVYGQGSGADGPITVSSTTYTDAVRSQMTASAASGQPTVTVSSAASFTNGDLCLVIQMRGTGAGQYEEKTISSKTATTITFTTNLTYSYTDDGSAANGTNAAQVIRVPQYTNVNFSGGNILTCNDWDGMSGGVVYFLASGTINTTNGTISATGKGGVGGTGGSKGVGPSPGTGGGGGGGNGDECGSMGDGSDGSSAANATGGTGCGGQGGSGGGGSGGSGGKASASIGTTGGAGSAALVFGGAGGTVASTSSATNNSTVSGWRISSGTGLLMGGGGGGGNGGNSGLSGGGGGGSGGAYFSGNGGSDGSQADGGVGGAGGDGGGIIYFNCAVLSGSGNIESNGVAGAAGGAGSSGCGGGGGGGGGYSGLCSPSGGSGGDGESGQGGNGGNGGGGGAPGSICALRTSTSGFSGSLVTTVGSAGAAGAAGGGSGCTCFGGSNGSAGTAGAIGTGSGKTFTSGLPVKYLFFNGLNEGEINRLDWRTASETNCDRFELERSVDGTAFQFISSIKGNGTSSVEQSYFLLDESPYFPITYYRLKQIDFDGAYEYSSVISVVGSFVEKTFFLRPNPAKDKVELTLDINSEEKVLVKFTGVMGRVVLVTSFQAQVGVNNFLVDLSDIPQGFYLVTVETKAHTYFEKLVLE